MKKRLVYVLIATIMITTSLGKETFAEGIGDMEYKPKLVSIAEKAEDSDNIQIDTASPFLTQDIESVPIVIQHPAMKENVGESATLTLVYSFEPLGCKVDVDNTIEQSEIFTTGDSNGEVKAIVSIAKDSNNNIATGIYKLNATVSRGDKSVSNKFTLEIIPEDAIVRFEYDATSFRGNPEDEEGDFWYEFNKKSGYFNNFDDAVDYSNEHSGTILTLLKDEIDFGFKGIGNNTIIDANGHNIGIYTYNSDTLEYNIKYLNVSGKVYLTNVTGTLCLETSSYINTDIEVMNVLDGFDGAILYPDINYVERCSARPLLSFNDEEYGAKDVAISFLGYTAVDVNGGIAIEKSTERPFAILIGDSQETYKFVGYKTLKEAFDNIDQGDGYVYVLSYIPDMPTSSILPCNQYNYIGEISEEQYSKLRTFVRITDGNKSDFYTIVGSGTNDGTNRNYYSIYVGGVDYILDFKYTNLPGIKENVSQLNEEEKELFCSTIEEIEAVLNIPDDFANARNDGDVDIINNWVLITDNDNTISDDGAYIINGDYTINTKNTMQPYFRTIKKMTFYSKNSNTVLNLSADIEANLYGKYAEVNIEKANVNFGTDGDYTGKNNIGKMTVITKGQINAGNRNSSVTLGAVELYDNAFFSATNVSLSNKMSVNENHAALSVSANAFASLNDCIITINGINGASDSLYGINNNGIVIINGGKMNVNNNGHSGDVHGIHNEGTVILGGDTKGKGIALTMTKGVGIYSVGEEPVIKLSAADISLVGSQSIGIDVRKGTFSVRSGPYEYYPQNLDYPGVSVNAKDTALKIADGVKWEISGSRNNVSFTGGNYSIYSESEESISQIVDFNISYGHYLGKVKILDKTGFAAVKSVLPILNFYPIQNKDGSISIHNAEGELHEFLTKDVKGEAEYTLPCFVCPNFYQNTVFGNLIPDGSKTIVIGQGEHIVHFSDDPNASTQINRCIIIGEAEDSSIINIPKGAALTFDGGSWINQGIGLTAKATLINILGGTFKNGQRGKGNGVFLSTGNYGVLFETDEELTKEKLNNVNTDAFNIAIYNGSGYCELNGGLCDSVVLNDGGTTKINDKAICSSVGEIYHGIGNGELTINSAQFYGYYNLPQQSEWTAVFSTDDSSNNRLIVGKQPGDNAVIPFGRLIEISDSQEKWQDKLILSETDSLHTLKMSPKCIFTITSPIEVLASDDIGDAYELTQDDITKLMKWSEPKLLIALRTVPYNDEGNAIENKIRTDLNLSNDIIIGQKENVTVEKTFYDGDTIVDDSELVHELSKYITVSIKLNDTVSNIPAGYRRTYKVYTVHNNISRQIDNSDIWFERINGDIYINFKEKFFSVYEIAYVDTKIPNPGTNNYIIPKTGIR